MKELQLVVDAQHEGGYRVRLTFSDGTVGVVHFEPWLRGPVFEPLLVQAYFERFFIEGGTITWPNGADIAPETLHECATAGAAA